MQFRAEEYYQASLERMQYAHQIYWDGTTFALAMYCGGLSVECLLRAFRWTEDSTFEGRHDLSELLKASKFFELDDEYPRHMHGPKDTIKRSGLNLRGAMNQVIFLWHNNLRFASEKSLKAFLKRIGRLQGVKGDPLKKNAMELINAAQIVVARGIALWTSMKKS
jgi:hypothetical protein